jgi:hypothetical protein
VGTAIKLYNGEPAKLTRLLRSLLSAPGATHRSFVIADVFFSMARHVADKHSCSLQTLLNLLHVKEAALVGKTNVRIMESAAVAYEA